MQPNIETVHIYGVPLVVQWIGAADIESTDFHVHLEGHCIKGMLSGEVKNMIASQMNQKPRDGHRGEH